MCFDFVVNLNPGLLYCEMGLNRSFELPWNHDSDKWIVLDRYLILLSWIVFLKFIVQSSEFEFVSLSSLLFEIIIGMETCYSERHILSQFYVMLCIIYVTKKRIVSSMPSIFINICKAVEEEVILQLCSLWSQVFFVCFIEEEEEQERYKL